MPQIREILLVLDPTKPPKELEAYLREGLDLKQPREGEKKLPELPDEKEKFDPEVFFANLSRRLLKRTGPPPGEKERSELNRRGSMVFGGGGLQSPNKRASQVGMQTPDASSQLQQQQEEKANANTDSPDVPRSRLRSDRRQPITPSSPDASPAGPPIPSKPIFSNLARRISMARSPNMALVVQQAKEQAEKERAAAKGVSPRSTLATANSISLFSLSRRGSLVTTSTGETSPNVQRSLQRTGSLERLEDKQRQREAARSEWESNMREREKAEATKAATVIPMRREEADDMRSAAAAVLDGSYEYEDYAAAADPFSPTDTPSPHMRAWTPPNGNRSSLMPLTPKSGASSTSSAASKNSRSHVMLEVMSGSPFAGSSASPRAPTNGHTASPASSTFSPPLSSARSRRLMLPSDVIGGRCVRACESPTADSR